MYYGEAHTSVDEKGRLNVPQQFREIMAVQDHDTWYMTRGFDGAIFVFEKERWTEVLAGIEAKEKLNPNMLDFRRFFLGSVGKVKRDQQGRLLIPSHLREYAGIEREAVLLGVEDHLEIWSKDRWRAFQQRQQEQYKAMAAELFGPRKADAALTQGAG